MKSAKGEAKDFTAGVQTDRVLGGPGKWMRFTTTNEEKHGTPAVVGFQSQPISPGCSIGVGSTCPKESWVSEHKRTFQPIDGSMRQAKTTAHVRPGRVPLHKLPAMFDESKESLRRAYSMPIR